MSFSLTIQRRVTNSALSFVANSTHTGDSQVVMDETVPDSTTDKEYVLGIDVSQLQVIAILASEDMTIKTNDSGSPQETISLTADDPVIFETGDTALFAGDVTSIFVSNASGSSGTLKINALMATA